MELADSHCHLNHAEYDADREEVIARAREKGIQTIIIPGFDLPSSSLALEIAAKHSSMAAAVGFHPNDADKWTDTALDKIKGLLQQPLAVAIGEIGLDYYRNDVAAETQQMVLQAQLQIASETTLPVLIHSRNATHDMVSALDRWYDELVKSNSALAQKPGIIHSFEGTYDTAMHYIQMNFLLGVNGAVTFKNATERQELVADLPLDKLVLETDAPYLSPHPYRGQRNEPARIYDIMAKIALLKDISNERVAEVTTHNVLQLFKQGL